MNDTEEITLDQVREGDKITATFQGDRAGEYTIIGKVWASGGGALHIGGRYLPHATKIVRHAPDWRNARVVQVAGRTFARLDHDSLPWREVPSDDDEWQWHSNIDLLCLGHVQVIIDADGQVAGR